MRESAIFRIALQFIITIVVTLVAYRLGQDGTTWRFWLSDTPRLDELTDRVVDYVDNQRYFTAVRGGDFTEFKKELQNNERFKCLVIMSTVYKAVNQRPLVETPHMKNPADPEEILEMGKPACQQMVIVFREIAGRLGLETRSVGIHYPAGSLVTHALAEVYYDSKWHLFDPSFLGYYTASGTPEEEIVSFQYVVKHPEIVPRGTKVQDASAFQHSYYMMKNFYPKNVLDDLKLDIELFPNGLLHSPATFSEAEFFTIDGERLENPWVDRNAWD